MTIDWASLCIGMIVAAYWARVARLAWKTRRQGKSPHFWPPDPIERMMRILWVPAVSIWVAYPFVAAFDDSSPAFRMPALAVVAVVIAAVAFAATLVCWGKMGRSWRMGTDPNEKTQLVVSGPFAYVRHPIYALSSILMLATMVAVPYPPMLIAGVIHLLLLQWQARREEKYLLKVHGQQYQDYLLRVGRFIPKSLSPYRQAR